MSRRTGFVLALALLATPLCSATLNAQSGVPDLEQEIRQRAAQIESKLIAWRRDIHENPELGEQENRTAALVAEHLKKLGLEVRTAVGPHRRYCGAQGGQTRARGGVTRRHGCAAGEGAGRAFIRFKGQG